MAKDTTSSGVSTKSADDVDNSTTSQEVDLDNVPALEAEPTLSQRDESVSDIVAKARENRSKETGYMDDEGAEPDGSDLNQMNDASDESVSAESEKSPTIKIDGQTIEVSQAEIDDAGGVVALQKDRAAAERMRQATIETQRSSKREQELNLREQQINAREAEIAAQATTNTQKPPVTDADANLEATAKQLAEKIYSGEEDQAEEAILAILQRNGANQPVTTNTDTAALTQEITQKVKWDLEKSTANQEFTKEYPKLDKTPILRNLVNEETKRLVREHPEWGPRKIIMSAGENVTDQFKAELGNVETTATDTRQSRKQSMDNVTGANSRRPAATEKKALSKSQVVAQMMQSRSGQQN